jgi:hypothetical protein
MNRNVEPTNILDTTHVEDRPWYYAGLHSSYAMTSA